MRRLVMVWAAAALMAALMAVMAVPATANNLFDDNGNFVGGVLNDGNDLFNNDIFDHHHRGFFDRNDEEEDLDTIRVGDLECLVEDGDDVDFCVNRHTGEIFRDF